MSKGLKEIIIIILLLLIGGVVLNKCSSSKKPIIVSEVTDTTYIEVEKLVENYIPVVEKEYIHITDTLYINDTTIIREGIPFTTADTLAIVNEFFKKKQYVDSLETDYGYVIVEDTIWQNRIYSRNWKYNFSIPEITTTKTVMFEDNPFKLYVGADTRIGFSETNGGILYDPLLEPQAYIGTQFRLGSSHYLKAEVDGLRRDLVLGYAYNKDRWRFKADYSWKYNTLDAGVKNYINK